MAEKFKEEVQQKGLIEIYQTVKGLSYGDRRLKEVLRDQLQFIRSQTSEASL